jgi:hypothetical protein
MVEPQLIRRKKRKQKRRQRDDREQSSDAAMHSAGLASLQQSVGNRAVQRMLAQEPTTAVPVTKNLMQPQAENEEQDTGAAPSILDEIIAQEAEKEPSSVELLDEFPVSDELNDLDSNFRPNVRAFVELLEQAGASVEILATTWPPELAYVMHWAWRIAKEDYHPLAVPPIDEIEFDADVNPDLDISWWHGSFEASKEVAEEIVEACGLDDLEEPPALVSHHVAGEAIDMKISWHGDLFLPTPSGGEIVIASSPHDETNRDLIALAAAYGIILYEDMDKNPVHWSVDGA